MVVPNLSCGEHNAMSNLTQALQLLDNWLTFTNDADPEWKSPEDDTIAFLDKLKKEALANMEMNWEYYYDDKTT